MPVRRMTRIMSLKRKSNMSCPTLSRVRSLRSESGLSRVHMPLSTVRQKSTLSRPLPKGTWDSHMHVVDPVRFPLAADAQYQPHPHTLADAKTFYSRFGIENMVFVQPSIYGDDNSCMLEALEKLTSRYGCAVVALDPKTIDHHTMEKWHAIAVRGARLN